MLSVGLPLSRLAPNARNSSTRCLACRDFENLQVVHVPALALRSIGLGFRVEV